MDESYRFCAKSESQTLIMMVAVFYKMETNYQEIPYDILRNTLNLFIIEYSRHVFACCLAYLKQQLQETSRCCQFTIIFIIT